MPKEILLQLKNVSVHYGGVFCGSKIKASKMTNLTYILHSLIKWAQYENTK